MVNDQMQTLIFDHQLSRKPEPSNEERQADWFYDPRRKSINPQTCDNQDLKHGLVIQIPVAYEDKATGNCVHENRLYMMTKPLTKHNNQYRFDMHDSTTNQRIGLFQITHTEYDENNPLAKYQQKIRMVGDHGRYSYIHPDRYIEIDKADLPERISIVTQRTPLGEKPYVLNRLINPLMNSYNHMQQTFAKNKGLLKDEHRTYRLSKSGHQVIQTPKHYAHYAEFDLHPDDETITILKPSDFKDRQSKIRQKLGGLDVEQMAYELGTPKQRHTPEFNTQVARHQFPSQYPGDQPKLKTKHKRRIGTVSLKQQAELGL